MNFNGRVRRIQKILTGPRAIPNEELTQILYFYSEPPEAIEEAILKRREELRAKYGESALEKIKFTIYRATKIQKEKHAGTSEYID